MSSDGQIVEEKIIKVNGDVAIKRYSKGRFLGKGGFAKVYEFLCIETKQVTAGKIMEKSALSKARARQKLMSEIKIHRSLHHTNIVRFEHFFEDENNVYIMLELCTNQSLNDLVRRRKRLIELEVQCYLQQTLSALKYMHSHRVIHRDIKLGNIFLSDKMEIKMGDYGLAAKLEFEGERKRTICGTPNYIAPEILDGRSGHSYEVDVWSFGVLMYTMLTGKPPFETNDVKTTYKRIKMNAYTFPDHVTLSEEAKDLISRILVTDPLERPSIDEILNHGFFTKNPIPKLLPTSTLAVPPSSSYMRQFEKNFNQRPVSRGRDEQVLKPPRSSSQPHGDEERKDVGRLTPKDSRRLGLRERSDSGGSASGSGSNTKKVATTSIYAVTPDGPLVWVKKWVDYSNKYGLGYMLSNGCAGVFFNDSTKIVGDPKGENFQYMSRPSPNKDEEMISHSLTAYPAEFQKKVTLLQHFRKHLAVTDPINEVSAPLTFIKKWLTTQHAVIFRLSNKVVQVYFQDKTELMLCSGTKQVVYIDKTANISVFPLATAMESGNREMTKRLRYTKEILTNMLQPPVETKQMASPRSNS
jgi:polo-like kinase 1